MERSKMSRAAFIFLAGFFVFFSHVGLDGAGLTVAKGVNKDDSPDADNSNNDEDGKDAASCDESLLSAVASAASGQSAAAANPMMMQQLAGTGAQAASVSQNADGKTARAAKTIYKTQAGISGAVGSMSMIAGTQCLKAISKCKSQCNQAIEGIKNEEFCEPVNEGHKGFSDTISCDPCGKNRVFTSNCDKAEEKNKEYEGIIDKCKGHNHSCIAALAQGTIGLSQAALQNYIANLMGGGGKAPEKPEEEEDEEKETFAPTPLTASGLGDSSGQNYQYGEEEEQKESYNSPSFGSFAGADSSEESPAAAAAEEDKENPEKKQAIAQLGPRSFSRGAGPSGGSSGSGKTPAAGGGLAGAKAGFARAGGGDKDGLQEEEEGRGYGASSRRSRGGGFAGGSSRGGRGSGRVGWPERDRAGSRIRKNMRGGRKPASEMKRSLKPQGGRHMSIFDKMSRLVQAFCEEGELKCE